MLAAREYVASYCNPFPRFSLYPFGCIMFVFHDESITILYKYLYNGYRYLGFIKQGEIDDVWFLRFSGGGGNLGKEIKF